MRSKRFYLYISRHWFFISIIFTSTVIIICLLFSIKSVKSSKHSAFSIRKSNEIIKCNEPLVDFGKFYRPVKQEFKHSFKIKNVSRQSVKLSIASKSCNCSEVSLESEELARGKETELKIAWKVPNVPGDNSFGISLKTIPSGSGLLRLGGKVYVEDCIRIEPRELDLGNIKPNEIKSREITVSAPREKSLSSGVSFIKGSQKNEFDTIITDKTDIRLVLEVSIKGIVGEGRQNYSVTIKTGNPLQPEIEIPVHVNHLNAYQAQPAAVIFRKEEIENQIKWVDVVSNIGIPAKIDKIVIDDPNGISAQVQKSNSSVKLGLKPKAEKEENGSYFGTVKAFIVGQDNPVLIRYMCL